MYTSTTCAAQGGAFAFVVKARANPTDSLTGTLTKGNVLLHRDRQGAGQLGFGIDQGIVAGRDCGIQVGLQIP